MSNLVDFLSVSTKEHQNERRSGQDGTAERSKKRISCEKKNEHGDE